MGPGIDNLLLDIDILYIGPGIDNLLLDIDIHIIYGSRHR